MSRDFPVTGLADLDRFLSAFPEKLQKAAYRQGLTAAAAPVRDKARELARKRSGKMAKAIKTGSPRQNEDGTFSVSIRLSGEHSFLGLFHEFGVAAHVLNAGDSKYSARLLTASVKDYGTKRSGKNPKLIKIAGNWIGGLVMHPGFAAHPFMRPALDLAADDAVRAFAVRIRDYMEGKSGFVAPLDEAA